MALATKGNLPAGSVAVHCSDFAGRPRSLVITLLTGVRISVSLPPGELAMLTSAEVQHLRDELHAVTVHSASEMPACSAVAAGSNPVNFHVMVPCHDGFGRDRSVMVFADNGGRITISAPAGGVAVLTSATVGRLDRALRDARDIVVAHGSDSVTAVRATSAIDRFQVAV